MAGWIKLYRDLLNKPIWIESSPEQKAILITLLMMVNHQENEWEWQGKLYSVKPGQVITSLDSIAQKCGKGVSIQNVRTALKRFEKYGFLTNESTNKNRLITIVKWGFYQNNAEELTSKLTGDQQKTNKRLTSNKNDKELKNDNEVKKPSSRKSEIYDEESVPFQLALRLFKNIRKNNAGFKEPNLQKWSDDFRLMMERDNRTEEQIVYLIDWCQQNSFWKANILSPSKLRKQFDQLVLKIQAEKQIKHIKNPQQFSLDRPSHWEEPNSLSKEELDNLRKMEEEMPF
ncbi:DNA replication protein DnaD [Sutcliffiella horikoshii]|uniref:DNA replication protein DnaD n=1 Tax=Sutcliffiella horikoshii TaxID=79883 RepID=UPI00384B461A